MLANGYVHALIDRDYSLKEWAMVVAGVKDASFDPDPYHQGQMLEDQVELDHLNSLSDEDLIREEQQYRAESLVKDKQAAIKAKRDHDICAKMRVLLDEWQAPKILSDIREYMVDSLAKALDGDSDYYEERLAYLNAPIDVVKLRAEKKRILEQSIAYHKAGWEEAIAASIHRKAVLAALQAI
jgi:hypothetical protein